MSDLRDIVDRLRDREAVVLSGLFHAIPTMAEAADAIASLRACVKWTDEVYPDRIYGKGARVELTWDEFNAMRVAAGFKPRGRIDDDERKSGLNHRLRVRIQELEAQLASAQVAERDANGVADKLAVIVRDKDAQLASARKALRDLYEWCRCFNDFRPDSRVGRQAKAALTDEEGAS